MSDSLTPNSNGGNTEIEPETVQLWEEHSQLFNALHTERRLKAFFKIADGDSPKEVAQDLDVSRSALQPYLNDFVETDLLDKDGKKYETTELTFKVCDFVYRLEDYRTTQMQEEFEKLKEKLQKNS